MVLNIILMIIGILALIESIFTLSFPKVGLNILKKMGIMKNWQNIKAIKKVAQLEFVIAIIIFIIGMNI